MSTSLHISAHAVREHIKKKEMTCTLSFLQSFNGSELEELIGEYICALANAQRGPARDNAFTELVIWLIERHRFEEATDALLLVGADSRVNLHQFAEAIEEKIREYM